MKLGISLLMAATGVLAVAQSLSQYSNQELLDEIARRLAATGGAATTATYICDNAYLYITLTGPGGKTNKKYYTTPSSDACIRQIGPLNRFKSKIPTTTTVAVCDSGNYLYQLQILPTAEFGNAPYLSNPNYDTCVKQAASLNSAN